MNKSNSRRTSPIWNIEKMELQKLINESTGISEEIFS
jgi:hypothetical protein